MINSPVGPTNSETNNNFKFSVVTSRDYLVNESRLSKIGKT